MARRGDGFLIPPPLDYSGRIAISVKICSLYKGYIVTYIYLLLFRAYRAVGSGRGQCGFLNVRMEYNSSQLIRRFPSLCGRILYELRRMEVHHDVECSTHESETAES